MRKRPVGFIVFFVSMIGFAAYWFFLSGLVRGFTFLPKAIINLLSFYMLSFIAAYGFAGISALLLKKWSRGLIIVLSLLGVLNMAGLIPLIHRDIIISEEVSLNQQYTKIEDISSKDLSLEDAMILGVQKALAKFFAQIGTYLAHFVIGIFEAISLLYMLLILFYFTRPKIKNLFE